jgi:alpha-beta hydrolase superfamily lysophospholipase
MIRPRQPHYSDFPQVRAAADRVQAAFGIRLDRTPHETWLAWRGHQIHVDDWYAVGRARGTVILVHGAGGHGRLLAPFAAPLASAGFSVRAPDLPGYGISLASNQRPPDYAEWVDLVAELADEASARGPVFLFGLSLGGLLSVFASQKARSVSGVIATTLIDPCDNETLLRVVRMRWIGQLALLAFRYGGRWLQRVALPLAFALPIETLTTDKVLARMLLRDPLIGMRRVSLEFFRSMHQYRAPRADYALPCPMLLVHPGADAWTPTAMSLQVYERIESAKSLVTLTNGAHAPLEAPAYAELCVAVLQFLERVGG